MWIQIVRDNSSVLINSERLHNIHQYGEVMSIILSYDEEGGVENECLIFKDEIDCRHEFESIIHALKGNKNYHRIIDPESFLEDES